MYVLEKYDIIKTRHAGNLRQRFYEFAGLGWQQSRLMQIHDIIGRPRLLALLNVGRARNCKSLRFCPVFFILLRRPPFQLSAVRNPKFTDGEIRNIEGVLS